MRKKLILLFTFLLASTPLHGDRNVSWKTFVGAAVCTAGAGYLIYFTPDVLELGLRFLKHFTQRPTDENGGPPAGTPPLPRDTFDDEAEAYAAPDEEFSSPSLSPESFTKPDPWATYKPRPPQK